MADREVQGYLRRYRAGDTGVLGPLVVDAAEGGFATTEVSERQRFDYYQPAGSSAWEVRYIGSAPQGTADTDPDWTIRRFSHQQFSGENRVTDIQVLTGAWSDRATLGWS